MTPRRSDRRPRIRGESPLCSARSRYDRYDFFEKRKSKPTEILRIYNSPTLMPHQTHWRLDYFQTALHDLYLSRTNRAMAVLPLATADER